MVQSIKEARRDQSRFEIERLVRELDEWQKRRKSQDQDENAQYRGQYKSQLEAVVNAVSGAAKVISDDMAAANFSALSSGEAYAKCNKYDKVIIWLWRVFNYFKEKFDQRDHPILQESLRAADEVLWSCYKPFFQKPHMANRREPPPLPYIETEFSPLAIRRDQSPGSLDQKVMFEPLKNYLRKMPVAVLRLPTTAVTSPWSLVLIGHEVGHFIQPMIEPGFGYATLLRESLDANLSAAGVSQTERDNWVSWAPEIFADWYSVLMMGQWAVWVMAQFEMKDREAMQARREDYPAPIVRLDLMAKFVDTYIPGEGTNIIKKLALDDEITAAGSTVPDLKATQIVCDTLTKPLPYGLGKFDDLLNFRAAEFQVSANSLQTGEVDQWSRALKGTLAKNNDQALRTARLIVAGAAKAWAEVMEDNEAKTREKTTLKLHKNTVDRVLRNGEKGTRSIQSKAEAPPGVELGKILLAADPSQLEFE
ncbi:MAG TPA: hypothetical protein VJR02_24530 [Pyrinomonadaceae bacterium]|nr:hypothetical protein [Pyrinomonadaceae bacterium]